MIKHFAGTDFNGHIADPITNMFLDQGVKIAPNKWQGVDVKNKPDMVTYELDNVVIGYKMTSILLDPYRAWIDPNLPWADDHFEERVCGYPINPGIQWQNWPWGKNADKFREKHGVFDHNYMQRYWPRYAHLNSPSETAEEWRRDNHGHRANNGIRGLWGDLNDVVSLMAKDPLTRQAYLPIFFPEDTGDANPGRKPCTLGYQFTKRNNRLNIYYPMRSCDFYRHFRDDVYMTVRLALWMLAELTKRDESWASVFPGTLTMHMTSLHMFANDYHALGKR